MFVEKLSTCTLCPMAEPELQATCQGLPLTCTRPLNEADLALISKWRSKRKQQAWVWGPAWSVLFGIPLGIPILVASGFLLEAEPFHAVLLSWALLMPLACLLGLTLECIWPTRPWTPYAIGITILLGLIGIVLNLRQPGAGDIFIWPMLLDVLFGLALFALKVADRWKLVRPSRVRKDLLKGEVWEFSAEDSAKLQILPISGLLLRAGEDSLASPLPMSVQMAAPIPLHRWEIPAYGIVPNQGEQRLTKRRMEPAEIQEAKALAKAHARGGFAAILLFILLSAILGISILIDLRNAEAIDLELAARWSLAGLFWSVTLASILNRRKLITRLKQDISNAALVVVRDHTTPEDAAPIAEILEASRIIWASQGRIGPLRQRYLKKASIRRYPIKRRP